MDFTVLFNTAEALLWLGVAVYLFFRLRPMTASQRWARSIAVAAFTLFSVSDGLEALHPGQPPLWLYALKIACGAAIFASRFCWIGWRQWHWRHPQFLFGLFCLVAVVFAIWFQHFRA